MSMTLASAAPAAADRLLDDAAMTVHLVDDNPVNLDLVETVVRKVSPRSSSRCASSTRMRRCRPVATRCRTRSRWTT